MTIARRSPLLLVAAIALAAAFAEAQEGELARGAALLAPFKQNLQSALRTGLVEGPIEAIAACRLRAPEIGRELSRDGVRLGRSSHRLRNSANVPPDWARPILDDYVASADRAPRAVPLSNGQSGYVEPILLQPLCVSCHGDVLAPDVADRIHELYPDDQAIGFQVGDFRGIFWVEFPAPK